MLVANFLRIFMSLLLCSVLIPALAYAEEQFDFRHVNWGMGKDEVKKMEGKKPSYEAKDPSLERHETIGFEDELLDKKVFLLYEFIDNKLYEAAYVFDVNHSNYNDFMTDYESLKIALTEKYGTPKEDKTNWKSDFFKKDLDNLGLAVATGGLVKSATWLLPRSLIACGIYGDSYKINVVARYHSVELLYDAEMAKMDKNKGKL